MSYSQFCSGGPAPALCTSSQRRAAVSTLCGAMGFLTVLRAAMNWTVVRPGGFGEPEDGAWTEGLGSYFPPRNAHLSSFLFSPVLQCVLGGTSPCSMSTREQRGSGCLSAVKPGRRPSPKRPVSSWDSSSNSGPPHKVGRESTEGRREAPVFSQPLACFAGPVHVQSALVATL